jgi:thiosulfate/3-mercaptopyruvate sulfurtransferase
MNSPGTYRILALLVISCCAPVLLVLPLSFAETTADPWNNGQTVQPADLVKELGDSKAAPTVVFVGFKRLYTSGHIKGAQYRGTAANEDGLKELKTWAAFLPRSTSLIIYCGCCPMERCPNIRPAFTALRDLGFTKLRLLILPTSFAVDWAEKGYAYDKNQ